MIDQRSALGGMYPPYCPIWTPPLQPTFPDPCPRKPLPDPAPPIPHPKPPPRGPLAQG